ncbi:MAG: hypothetical protein KBS62_03455 [Oscillospiraceae bacterium]|nr:hypothetical protein [Candidatus Ruminococcus equi]
MNLQASFNTMLRSVGIAYDTTQTRQTLKKKAEEEALKRQTDAINSFKSQISGLDERITALKTMRTSTGKFKALSPEQKANLADLEAKKKEMLKV